MNLLYVSSSTIPSQTANAVHVMQMCNAFSSLGHSVTLVAQRTSLDVGSLQEYYGTEHAFEILRLPWPASRLGGLVYGLGLARHLRGTPKPDLVYGRCLQGILTAELFGLPVIYESHAPPQTRLRREAEARLLRSRRLVRLVVISRALKGIYEGMFPRLPRDKIVVAPDAAAIRKSGSVSSVRQWPGRSTAVQVGYTGHLYRGRGIGLLLEVARQLPQIDMHIVGGTRPDLEAWKSQNPPLNVHFHGFVPPAQVASYQERCDILLLPYQKRVAVAGGKGDTSRWMSPLKLFEYMASGKPIVASRLPVIQEILEDGRNAILIAPDDAAMWTESVERLAEDPELRVQLATQARKDLEERYTWTKRARSVLASISIPI